jgi:hypothetical protein
VQPESSVEQQIWCLFVPTGQQFAQQQKWKWKKMMTASQSARMAGRRKRKNELESKVSAEMPFEGQTRLLHTIQSNQAEHDATGAQMNGSKRLMAPSRRLRAIEQESERVD